MKNQLGFFISAFISGFIFAFGLAVGGMLDPANVQGFLDVYNWKPGLMGVMGGAMLTFFIAHRLAMRMKHPVFALSWSELPKIGFDIPKKVIIGNILFGVGWALSGFCPGPALASVVTLSSSTIYFVVAMVAGFVLWELLLKKI